MFTLIGAGLLSTLGSLVVPAFVVVWAALLNRRIYKLTVRDLVWGGVALCLVEEQFSHMVEEAKRQRYRPNPNPVKPGNSLADRLNHFAYHYRLYYRLSYGPSELQVPLTIQGNCWVEGVGIVLSCCLSIVGIGLLLFIPLVLRSILVWPRIIAIKQATIDFLSGKFDADLQLMAEQKERAAAS